MIQNYETPEVLENAKTGYKDDYRIVKEYQKINLKVMGVGGICLALCFFISFVIKLVNGKPVDNDWIFSIWNVFGTLSVGIIFIGIVGFVADFWKVKIKGEKITDEKTKQSKVNSPIKQSNTLKSEAGLTDPGGIREEEDWS